MTYFVKLNHAVSSYCIPGTVYYRDQPIMPAYIREQIQDFLKGGLNIKVVFETKSLWYKPLEAMASVNFCLNTALKLCIMQDLSIF